MNGTLPRRVTLRPLKARKYTHFDTPLPQAQLDSFSLSTDEVVSHAFFPLLGYKKVRRTVDFSVFPPIVKQKDREIRYASHLDAAIYSLYAQELDAKYEHALKTSNLDNVVLAYRRNIGYNVPFAGSLIAEVRQRQTCSVICLDISGFFDGIPHDILRTALRGVLCQARLTADWYKIFRRVTAFEYVDRETLEKVIGRSKGTKLCEIEQFRSKVRPIIQRNTLKYGIPQGTPLSGLLANVFMIEFDKTLNDRVLEFGGSYRRYSDDIAVVVPEGVDTTMLVDLVRSELSIRGLALNEKKTSKTRFHVVDGELRAVGDPLQYLGFTFDGTRILIRPESIKAFYAKMKRNISHYVRSAARKGIPLSELRKRVLIGRFTHWGDNKNFVQYAYRAARELNAPEIKRQLRNHVAIFDRQWSKMVKRHESGSAV